MITIRKAAKEDIETMLDYGALMHKESDYQDLPFDRDYCRVFLLSAIDDSRYGCFLADENQKVIGGILAFSAPFFFCSAKRTFDLYVYVAADYRGTRAALLLVRSYEMWAESIGAVRAYLGSSTGTEITDAFYPRLGYIPVGGVFRKKLKVKGG